MKPTPSKENASSSRSAQLVFNKIGEGNSLTSTDKSEQPFFSPNPEFQKSSFSGGNEVTHTPFSSPNAVVQTKLTINEPGDQYEQEADAMADRVMGMPSLGSSAEGETPAIQRMPFFGNEPIVVQRKCASCGEKEKVQRQEMDEEEPVQTKLLMRKAEGGGYAASPQLTSQLSNSKGSGDPLSSKTLGAMNQAFGADFSKVRIHTGSQAAEMSQGIQAKAFTHGSNIYFNRSQYQPETEEGKKLLAHELVHTVQQGAETGKKIQRKLLFESTIDIRRRALFSREFKVKNGGIRVVILPYGIDTERCDFNDYWITLMSPGYIYNDNIFTCAGNSKEKKTFLMGGLGDKTYQLRIIRTSTNHTCPLAGDILVFDEPIEKNNSTCELDEDPTAMDIVHGALDIAGFVPVLGAIPDAINAIIYVGEGDWGNAGLSAFAMVPLIGDGAKATVMGGKVVIKFKVTEKTVVKLGEEGLVKAFKEAKAIHEAEEAAKLASKIEKEGLEKVEKEVTGKTALEKTEKEAVEKAKKKKGSKKPLKWNSTITRPKVTNSGGIVGGLEYNYPLPAGSKQGHPHAHHPWPKFMGGLEKQPLMLVDGLVHNSILHPLLLLYLKGLGHNVLGNQSPTHPTNATFISKLRTDIVFRSLVTGELIAFYVVINQKTDPQMPTNAYTLGIQDTFSKL